MDQRQLLLKVCTCLGGSLLHFWLTKNIFSEAKCDIFGLVPPSNNPFAADSRPFFSTGEKMPHCTFFCFEANHHYSQHLA